MQISASSPIVPNRLAQGDRQRFPCNPSRGSNHRPTAADREAHTYDLAVTLERSELRYIWPHHSPYIPPGPLVSPWTNTSRYTRISKGVHAHYIQFCSSQCGPCSPPPPPPPTAPTTRCRCRRPPRADSCGPRPPRANLECMVRGDRPWWAIVGVGGARSARPVMASAAPGATTTAPRGCSGWGRACWVS